MPTICNCCGNKTYVIYVKENGNFICCICEDRLRLKKEHKHSWQKITEKMYKKYKRRIINGKEKKLD